LRFAQSACLVLILSNETGTQSPLGSESFEFTFDLKKHDLPQDNADVVAAVLSLVDVLRVTPE
jgi:hypothetical protein